MVEQFILIFGLFEILCFYIDEPMPDMLKVEIIVLVSEMSLGIWKESLQYYLFPMIYLL